MFTFLQLLCACIVCFVVGVIFHAAISAWFDRISTLMQDKARKELAELKERMSGLRGG